MKNQPPQPGAGEFPGQNQAMILSILRTYKKIAMVGLSPNPIRPSYFAATYLRAYGYQITPVNPAASEIFGVPAVSLLADVPGPLEVVDIFRKASEVPAVVEQAIELGAKVIWMQLGVIHREAAIRAKEAGLEVVMDRCMKIEHARFYGGLNAMGIKTGVISSRKGRKI